MTENLYITLEEIKAHLHIDETWHGEDEYLLSLAEVVIGAVENHIDNYIDDFVEDGQLDPPLKHACLLLIGNFYQNRESVTFGTAMPIPHGYEYLLQPYINYESGTTKSTNRCQA